MKSPVKNWRGKGGKRKEVARGKWDRYTKRCYGDVRARNGGDIGLDLNPILLASCMMGVNWMIFLNICACEWHGLIV